MYLPWPVCSMVGALACGTAKSHKSRAHTWAAGSPAQEGGMGEAMRLSHTDVSLFLCLYPLPTTPSKNQWNQWAVIRPWALSPPQFHPILHQSTPRAPWHPGLPSAPMLLTPAGRALSSLAGSAAPHTGFHFAITSERNPLATSVCAGDRRLFQTRALACVKGWIPASAAPGDTELKLGDTMPASVPPAVCQAPLRSLQSTAERNDRGLRSLGLRRPALSPQGRRW